MDACTNPDILRVIYFFLLIVDIVKIIIPIALIVLGIIDFSKSVITSDEKVQKKAVNLFFKRLLYAILVFAVPWIVEVLMVTLGDLLSEEVNFTDCIDNANSECIEALDSNVKDNITEKCDVDYEYGNSCYNCVEKKGAKTIMKYEWGYELDDNFSQNSSKKCLPVPKFESKESCLDANNSITNCYYCSETKEYIFGEKPQKKCGNDNNWEIDYMRDEQSCNQQVNDNGYKCYVCPVNELYYWRDKKPSDVCLDADGWGIDYTITEEKKCKKKSNPGDKNYYIDILQ